MELQSFPCEICLNPYNDRNRIPHIIPTCGHNMCSACLSTFLISNPTNIFTCPFDSSEFRIDNSGISNFPKNTALLNAMKKHELSQQNLRKERTKSLTISRNSSSSCSSLNTIDKEDQQPASEELKLVVENKLKNLEQAISQIEAFEQKIYDNVEEAVVVKEKHILKLLDQKFEEFHAILDNKKREMASRVTAHFSSVRDRVKNKQNPHESQYEAKTRVIEWKNLVKRKMSTWDKIKTVEAANEIIEEDETAMAPEVSLWTTRIENVIGLGNMDKLVDKSFMVFDEEFVKTVGLACEFKVMQGENVEKENVFGSAEKNIIREEPNKADSDTSPQDMTDKRKFISQMFKAYNLKVDPTFKEVDKLKIRPKANNLLLPATSKDRKKKKFMFENFDSFEKLEIHCEDFKDKNLSSLSEALQFFNMLKELRIIFTNCDKVYDNGLEALGGSIQSLPNLQNLTIEYLSSSSKITDQGLTKFFKKISASQTLQRLAVSFEKLPSATEKGFAYIWEDLSSLSALTHLKMTVPPNVNVSDEGLLRIANGLRQMTRLEELEVIMNGNEKLGNKGFSQLSESLGKLIGLSTLKICFKESSGNINDGSFSSLTQTLYKLINLKSLSLEFPKCYVSNEKFTEFSQVFTKLNFLKQLNLNFSWSLLSDESLKELSKAVTCLLSLTDLQLDFTACSFSNEGFKDLVEAISGLFNLNQLSLEFGWCKNISDEGIMCLGEAISKLGNLSRLEANFKEVRKITESSVMRLCGTVPKLQNIDWFMLNVVNCGRGLNEDSKLRMEEALSKGRRYVNGKIVVGE